MVPKDFRKPLCISAGYITLVVAVIWEAITIYIIGVYNCSWNFIGISSGGEITRVTTWFLFYFTYFDGKCGSSSSIITDPAKNLHVWMWIYTIVTAVWIPACILLIVAVVGEVRGRVGASLYYPWVSLTGVLSLLDLAATIYHFIDVFSTQTPDDWAEFVTNGASNWTSFIDNRSSTDVVSWMPSFYITLFCSRFVILWLLNLFFVYNVYKACSAVSLYKAKYPQSGLTPGKKTSWKDKFYQGPDPRELQQSTMDVSGNKEPRAERQHRSPENKPRSSFTNDQKNAELTNESSQNINILSQPRYLLDKFGIPIEELDTLDPREKSLNYNEGFIPHTHFEDTNPDFDNISRRTTQEPNTDRWQEPASQSPSGDQVPPELNKVQKFSYMAGDQPQLMRTPSRSKAPLSRSSSSAAAVANYPPIPRPDYTIASRGSASLEYVPNRFRLPSSPTSPLTKAPIPLKKPQVHPKPDRLSNAPLTPPPIRYIPQKNIPPQQQVPYPTRQTSQSTNYNINKLY